MLARALGTVSVAVALVLGAIGAVVAPTQALTGVGVGLVVAAVVAVMAPPIGPDNGARAPLAPHASGLVAGAVTIGGWLAVTGLKALLGPASGVVTLTLLLAAALMIWWRLHRRRAPAMAKALSTQQLCRAWRRSGSALRDMPDGPARREIVRVREHLLNELERRDPPGSPAGSTPTPAWTATQVAT